MLFTTQTSYAGNPWPPEAGECLVGPVIDAIVGIAFVPLVTPCEEDPEQGTMTIHGTDTLIWGTCQKEPIKINLFNCGDQDFTSGLTEQSLLYLALIPPYGTSFCGKKHVDQRLVIVDVKKFYKSNLGDFNQPGPHVIAEVKLMFVEPCPPPPPPHHGHGGHKDKGR